MTVVVLTPPDPLLDLEVVKDHLRVDGDDENELVTLYRDAATGLIDGPGGWLGRSLGEQTLALTVLASDWSGAYPLALPCGPVLELVSVVYTDAAGAPQTIAGVDGVFVLLASDHLALGFDQTFPSVRSGDDEITITYSVGSEAAAIKLASAAILLQIGDMYGRREPAPEQLSSTVTNLLSPLRKWSI